MPAPERTAPAAPEPGGVPRAGGPQLAGLDGLRALAVAAVITYHVDAGWLPGGYLGVDVFFGISGFLITYLLVGEHGAARPHRAGGLLAAARGTAAAGAAAGAHRVRGGDPAARRGRHRTRRRAARGRVRVTGVRRQLVADPRGRRLLPPPGHAADAPAPVVAERRGAVLPGVAGAAGHVPGAGARPAAALADHRPRRAGRGRGRAPRCGACRS